MAGIFAVSIIALRKYSNKNMYLTHLLYLIIDLVIKLLNHKLVLQNWQKLLRVMHFLCNICKKKAIRAFLLLKSFKCN